MVGPPLSSTALRVECNQFLPVVPYIDCGLFQDRDFFAYLYLRWEKYGADASLGFKNINSSWHCFQQYGFTETTDGLQVFLLIFFSKGQSLKVGYALACWEG